MGVPVLKKKRRKWRDRKEFRLSHIDI